MMITFYHNMLSSSGGDDNILSSPVEGRQGERQQLQNRATEASRQDKPTDYSMALWWPGGLL